MASVGKFVFFFFVFLVGFSSVRARESKFFSKSVHYSAKESSGGGASVEELAPAPAPVYSETNGYGLYGHETGLFPPSKETPTTATYTVTTTATTTTAGSEDENELLNQELDSYTYEKGSKGDNVNYNDNGYYTNNNNNNNNNDDYTTNNYNNDGYNNNNNKNTYKLASSSYVTGTQNNNGYTTYNNNEYTSNYNNNNKNNNGYTSYSSNINNNNDEYTSKDNNNKNNNGYTPYSSNINNNDEYTTTNNNNNNGYDQMEKQGMSDTRFMEGGKYYYDLNNEKNQYQTSGYETEVGKTKYSNEFNTMEEYENQEEYQESQNEP